jgi:hypothetical protein
MTNQAPLHHPLVDLATGRVTAPWVAWFQSISSLGMPQLGALADRPAAKSVPVGTLYSDTATGAVTRSNGTTWDAYT